VTAPDATANLKLALEQGDTGHSDILTQDIFLLSPLQQDSFVVQLLSGQHCLFDTGTHTHFPSVVLTQTQDAFEHSLPAIKPDTDKNPNVAAVDRSIT